MEIMVVNINVKFNFTLLSFVMDPVFTEKFAQRFFLRAASRLIVFIGTK